MRLSRLVYECVKASTAVHEVSFSFDDFMHSFNEGENQSTIMWGSSEYSRAFDRSFLDINAFFVRIMELDDILPDMTVEVTDLITYNEDDGEYHLDLSDFFINNIRLIFQYGYAHSKKYVRFDDFGSELLIHGYDKTKPVYLTYSIAIPRFTREDLKPYTEQEDEDDPTEVVEVDENIDLTAEYHIPEKAFALCIDYVHAKQLEDYEPAISSAMMVEVESKLQGLRKETVGPMYDHIEVDFRI